MPVLHTNLFSQGRMTDKGYVLTCDDKKCLFRSYESSDEGEIVTMGVRETALYKMQIPKENETTAFPAVKTVSIKSWHEIFAHQNIAHIN